jgi:hypothetical protein
MNYHAGVTKQQPSLAYLAVNRHPPEGQVRKASTFWALPFFARIGHETWPTDGCPMRAFTSRQDRVCAPRYELTSSSRVRIENPCPSPGRICIF